MTKRHDWERMEEWADQLRAATDRLQATVHSKPETLDGGPLTPTIMDMVEATIADLAHLELRMDASADRMHWVAMHYKLLQDRNLQMIERWLEPDDFDFLGRKKGERVDPRALDPWSALGDDGE